MYLLRSILKSIYLAINQPEIVIIIEENAWRTGTDVTDASLAITKIVVRMKIYKTKIPSITSAIEFLEERDVKKDKLKGN